MSEEAKKRAVRTKVRLAREDADRKAVPRTKLVGHFRAGDCVGPASVPERYELKDQK